jgi:methylated-DNA-[protein]-cysteine S-methyltransferase
MRISLMRYRSPLGEISCVFEGESLVEIAIKERPLFAPPGCQLVENSGLKKELDEYLAGKLKRFGQKIKFISGTPFEHKIWRALKKIPSGQTRTYKWIAEQAGSPKAVRAAGQALGKNPLPIIVPCHRVIASDGSLTGYSSGGVKVKELLLRLENPDA